MNFGSISNRRSKTRRADPVLTGSSGPSELARGADVEGWGFKLGPILIGAHEEPHPWAYICFDSVDFMPGTKVPASLRFVQVGGPIGESGSAISYSFSSFLKPAQDLCPVSSIHSKTFLCTACLAHRAVFLADIGLHGQHPHLTGKRQPSQWFARPEPEWVGTLWPI
jgi:hypothetical protein